MKSPTTYLTLVAAGLGTVLLAAACTPLAEPALPVADSPPAVAPDAPAQDESQPPTPEVAASAEAAPLPGSTPALDAAPAPDVASAPDVAPAPPAAAPTSAPGSFMEQRGTQPRAGVDVTAVQALPARAFTESVCVATHWNYYDTPYGSFDEASRLLVDSGIRHIRDGAKDEGSRSALRSLGERGVRTTFIMNPDGGVYPDGSYWNRDGASGARIDLLLQDVGLKAIDAVEIGNEWDLSYRGTRRFTDGPTLSGAPVDNGNGYREYATQLARDTRTALDINPATRDVPLVAPSYTNTRDYHDQGSLEPFVRIGNGHPYQAGRHPETTGWGDNGYGSRDWQRDNVRAQTPNGPIVATEGGYSTATGAGGDKLPEDVHAVYLPRLFMHYFNGGWNRFCSYEFIDEFHDPGKSNPEANYGIVRHDLSPKPAYYAVQNMLRVLNDPSGSAQGGPLRYAVSDPTVEQMLVHKGDGSFVLALWLGEGSWHTDGFRIDVPDRQVTVQLPDSGAVTTHRLDAAGSMSSAPAPLSGGRTTLSIGDEVTFVEIR